MYLSKGGGKQLKTTRRVNVQTTPPPFTLTCSRETETQIDSKMQIFTKNLLYGPPDRQCIWLAPQRRKRWSTELAVYPSHTGGRASEAHQAAARGTPPHGWESKGAASLHSYPSHRTQLTKPHHRQDAVSQMCSMHCAHILHVYELGVRTQERAVGEGRMGPKEVAHRSSRVPVERPGLPLSQEGCVVWHPSDPH